MQSSKPKTFNEVANEILLPLKLIIPQPIIAKVPGLTTNQEIRIEKVLHCFTAAKRCLDIGCGDNQLIKMHRARGGEGIGVDVYDWGDVDVVVEDTSQLDFPDKSFDCICFVSCLNHIPNREEVLRESHRLLRDDGIILATMLSPFLSLVWHKYAFWDKDQHERGMEEGEVYGFTDEVFRQLFSKTGFSIAVKRKFSLGLNNLYIAKKAA